MSKDNYIELYKKYRPVDFDSIVGQENVVRTVKNDIVNGRVPTGYLFAGKQHGCGKTSTAFIVAKALNCENPKADGNPCNECSTCQNIDNKRQIGVNYVSIANNGSVADIRKIVEQAQMAQPIKKPVWILDECHRMSKEAADALLIPLESTSMNSLFIFCSTEPEKIIDTVKSRLQVKSFTSISLQDIAVRLTEINEKENLGLTTEQIIQASREGNGSLRTAISTLELLASDGEISSSYKTRLLGMLAKTNYAQALSISAEMETSGQDFVKVTEQLYRDMSDLLLLIAGATPDSMSHNTDQYMKLAKAFGPKRIIGILDILGSTLQSMSYNTVDNRILFDIAMNKSVLMLKQK